MLLLTFSVAPVLEEVDAKLTDTMLNRSLWGGVGPLIWRGLPGSGEVNETWNSYEHAKPIALPRDQIIARAKTFLQWPSSITTFGV
ncbi:hypothetical protein F5Y11DRAFT_315989 [Daldinia sp. FL1419]|nr:hypothetical protein F5Y11DRAFT_315989 [Daldinia sp. FL1419]